MSRRESARDRDHPFDDPVPGDVVLSLDEAFRVLEAIEDARLALREHCAAPGLQDELATVILVLHGKLGAQDHVDVVRLLADAQDLPTILADSANEQRPTRC